MTADKGTYRQLPQNPPHGVEVRSGENVKQAGENVKDAFKD